MAQFKGVRKLSQKKYKSLKDSGELDNGVLYVTPETNTEKIEQLETTLTELTPDIMRSLKTPMSKPTSTELVAVDNTNAQIMLEIGDGLTVVNGTLNASGGNGTSKYLHNIVMEAVFTGTNIFTLSLQLLSDTITEITNLTELISALPDNKRIIANGYDGGLSIYAIKKSNSTITIYSVGSGTCQENTIPTFDSIINFTDYVSEI